MAAHAPSGFVEVVHAGRQASAANRFLPLEVYLRLLCTLAPFSKLLDMITLESYRPVSQLAIRKLKEIAAHNWGPPAAAAREELCRTGVC